MPGMSAVVADPAELILNNTWRPTRCRSSARPSLPEPELKPARCCARRRRCRLSFRTPPTADAASARIALEKALTTDVPYGAQVEVADFVTLNRWSAPPLPSWLAAALDELTGPVFSEPYRWLGIGGGIPFMEMLGRRYRTRTSSMPAPSARTPACTCRTSG